MAPSPCSIATPETSKNDKRLGKDNRLQYLSHAITKHNHSQKINYCALKHAVCLNLCIVSSFIRDLNHKHSGRMDELLGFQRCTIESTVRESKH